MPTPPRQPQRAGVQASRIEVVNKPRLGMWGRQLQAVRNFAINGGAAHTSKEDLDVLKPIMAAPTGMNTDVPSEGGFLVVPERATTIIQRSYETGAILSRVNRMPIGANSNGMKLPAVDETSRADNSRYGGIVSGWLGQGNTLTGGKPKFREMDLKLRKVGAFVYATDEQLADAVALEAWINKYLPLELAFRTEDAVINGDGSNKPQGVLNSGALISVTRGTTGHITADDFRGLYARMWAPLRSNAVFLIDQSCETDLDLLTIPIGTAGVLDPSFKAAGTVPGQKYPTYKGVPIITVEYCAALGTSGDLVMVNLDEYVLIDKGGVDQAVSLHVAFLTDEAVFRFMYRVDGQLTWNAALTPKSGGATLSSALVLST
jgi:HK97 family phage major capsid protein